MCDITFSVRKTNNKLNIKMNNTMNDAIALDNPDKIKLYSMHCMKQSLKLECIGIKFRGGSRYAYIKRAYGFKGSKQSVLEQFTKYIADYAQANSQLSNQ
jgi:hypothetical protein